MSFLSMRSFSKHSFSMRSLLVFSIMFIGIGSILSSVCLFSCSSSVKNPLLLSADSLMETHPDSALSILESISSPQKLTRAERAYYAVLLTQAKHKNYIPLDDDSLIKTAVEYYGDRKNSINAARAHYYLGATYYDKGSISFAVDEYLTAIRLMPIENVFLAKIYDNLAECYEEESLNDIAMDAYRASYQIVEGTNNQIFSLRGIASIYFSENRKDSALYYYQKALDYALAISDSGMIAPLYCDFAKLYNEKGDYTRANEYVSEAIRVLNQDNAVAYTLKAKILLNLNELDSAVYYFTKTADQLDIFGKAVYYDGMYQISKKRGEWEIAAKYADEYKMLYDSIQVITDNKELTQLMDKHQLEEHKRLLSQHTKVIVVSLASVVLLLIILGVFSFMWIDRKRKKRYIDLQKELNQNRVNTVLLNEKESSMSDQESINEMKIDLLNQQLNLCNSLFQPSDYYKKLEAMKKATPKQMLDMHDLVAYINKGIWETYVDVMTGLSKSGEKNLTSDDQFYCMLVLLGCSKPVIMELMGDTSDAIKTRKNRIKNKMDTQLFNYVFNSNNHSDRME